MPMLGFLADIPVVGQLLNWLSQGRRRAISSQDVEAVAKPVAEAVAGAVAGVVARPVNEDKLVGELDASSQHDIAWWQERGLPDPVGNAQIISYRRSTQPLPQIMECFFNSVRHDIWFVGANFPNTLTVRKNYIIDKLTDGIEFRFLIHNCLSQTSEELASRLGQGHASFLEDCRTTVVNLRSIVDHPKMSGISSRFQVKVSSTPTWRFYIFDRQHQEGMTFFVPFVFGENSPNLPGFLAPNTERGVLREYFDCLERLWHAPDTKDFESWYEREYKPKYPTDTLEQELSHAEKPTEIRFSNKMRKSVIVYWINQDDQEQYYKSLAPDENYIQQTYVNHRWVVRIASDKRQVRTATGTLEFQTIEIN